MHALLRLPLSKWKSKRKMRILWNKFLSIQKIFQFSTLSVDISTAFSEKRYPVKHVCNIKTTLFHYFLRISNPKKTILENSNITLLLNMKVTIKKPHKCRHNSPQYFNCQSCGCGICIYNIGICSHTLKTFAIISYDALNVAKIT